MVDSGWSFCRVWRLAGDYSRVEDTVGLEITVVWRTVGPEITVVWWIQLVWRLQSCGGHSWSGDYSCVEDTVGLENTVVWGIQLFTVVWRIQLCLETTVVWR